MSVNVSYQLHVVFFRQFVRVSLSLFLRIGREEEVWSGAVAYIPTSIFKICADFQEIVAQLNGRDIQGNDED